MTEAEWLACDGFDAMFDLLPAAASDRKLRLFSVACCRQVEQHLWAGSESHFAIKTAEVCADQLMTDEELQKAQQAVESRLELYPGEPVYDASFWACSRPINEAVWQCAFYAANCSMRPYDGKGPERDAEAAAARTTTSLAQCALLRDIFGNPFRPVAFSPSWRSSTAIALASQMYESRDFGAMPILADALQDAGCDSADVLGHCRGEGPHVRGCWAVDLVLGKEYRARADVGILCVPRGVSRISITRASIPVQQRAFMRIACFVFGIIAGALAGLFALTAAVQTISWGIGGPEGLERLYRERAFYSWSGLASAFATFSGLCFIAAAITRHAEQPRGDQRARGRGAPPDQGA